MRALPLLLSLLAVAGAAGEVRAEIHEVHEESFSLVFQAAAGRRVVVDDLSGAITVTGGGGDAVVVHVRQRISARSPERLAAARREVELRRAVSGETVRLLVASPTRCGHDDRDGIDREDRGWCESWESLGYRVTYDLELRVPADIELVARTVQDGDVVVRGVRGRLALGNVMGRVEAEGVEDCGRFVSVNAPVRVAFARNPHHACELRTVNGDLHARFQPRLDADLALSTMNGEIWSDFPYSYRALPAEVEHAGGRFVYRRRHGFGVRIGSGGPELRLSTLNGSIYLEQQNAKEKP